MARLLIYLVVASLVCRVITRRWPWQLLGLTKTDGREPRATQTRSAVEGRARALLGVRPGAGRAEIIEAHKRLVVMVHPDRGGTNEQVHEANAARDLLLARLPVEQPDSAE